MREIDYRALRYTAERMLDSPLKRDRILSKLDKAWRQGMLYVPKEESQDQKWRRCEARFLLGDYSDWGGWQYRSPIATRMWFENPFKTPIWKAERVKTLSIIGEQGIGDEVFFASVIPDMVERIDNVILETAPRLQSIFERS